MAAGDTREAVAEAQAAAEAEAAADGKRREQARPGPQAAAGCSMRVRRGLLRLPRRSLLAALFFFSLSSSLLYFVYVAPGIGKTGSGGAAVASRGPREPPPRPERTSVLAGSPARRRPRAWETESYGDPGLALGRLRDAAPSAPRNSLPTPAARCPPNPIPGRARRASTQPSLVPGAPFPALTSLEPSLPASRLENCAPPAPGSPLAPVLGIPGTPPLRPARGYSSRPETPSSGLEAPHLPGNQPPPPPPCD